METRVRLEELEREVLALSASDRARLACELLRSLDDVPPEDADLIWLEEAERRDRDLQARGDSGIEGAEALRQIRSRLHQR
jgi:hypothetical protein